MKKSYFVIQILLNHDWSLWTSFEWQSITEAEAFEHLVKLRGTYDSERFRLIRREVLDTVISK